MREENTEPADRHLTEQQALKEGKAQGYNFVDDYVIAHKDNPTVTVGIGHPTRKEAEAAMAELKHPGDYHILQRRNTVAPAVDPLPEVEEE